MVELFVGDVVYFTTPDSTLDRDKIKAIACQREKGRVKHLYLLFNGIHKEESELFLSLKRAKDYFEKHKMSITIPKRFET